MRKAPHKDSPGSSLFQAWGYGGQTYTITVNMVIKGHSVTDIRNALASGTVLRSLKH